MNKKSTTVLELKFDQPCLLGFKSYSAAFKWFRQKYNLHCYVHYHTKPCYSIVVYNDIDTYNSLSKKITYKTYEEAEEACFKKLIQMAKKRKNSRGFYF